jgi:hypothetical protein
MLSLRKSLILHLLVIFSAAEKIASELLKDFTPYCYQLLLNNFQSQRETERNSVRLGNNTDILG